MTKPSEHHTTQPVLSTTLRLVVNLYIPGTRRFSAWIKMHYWLYKNPKNHLMAQGQFASPSTGALVASKKRVENAK